MTSKLDDKIPIGQDK